MDIWKDKALKDAIHVDTRSQLPPGNTSARYYWQDGHCTVKGTERQLLEALMRRPIFCASRINLSAYVDRLRHDHGVPITTYQYINKETGGRFGVYALTHPVRQALLTAA